MNKKPIKKEQKITMWILKCHICEKEIKGSSEGSCISNMQTHLLMHKRKGESQSSDKQINKMEVNK